jgi:hypothetical protein
LLDAALKIKGLIKFKLPDILNQPTANFFTEEDKKQIFRKLIALIRANSFTDICVRPRFISEKDKVAFGEMLFRTLISCCAKCKLQKINGVNVG